MKLGKKIQKLLNNEVTDFVSVYTIFEKCRNHFEGYFRDSIELVQRLICFENDLSSIAFIISVIILQHFNGFCNRTILF